MNTLEPTLEAKYFHPGLRKGHVIGVRFMGRVITGYGGKVAPPFARYYMGGDYDIRGFDIYGVSPIVFLPTEGQVNVYNNDGTQRTQLQILNGVKTQVPVTMRIPIYQFAYPGGDTSLVNNFEYRIPIFGPVVLAAFAAVGADRLSCPGQLRLNPTRMTQLNSEFPEANFSGRAFIAPGTEKIRSSTGLELQVLMPVINAPFRVYFAYNPTNFRGYLQPPIAVDRSDFPNAVTYQNAIATIGQPIPLFERNTTFRFSIGRTF